LLVSDEFVGLEATFFVVFVAELGFGKLVGDGDGRFGLAGMLLFDQKLCQRRTWTNPSGIDLV
jgi:hypothetical protein